MKGHSITVNNSDDYQMVCSAIIGLYFYILDERHKQRILPLRSRWLSSACGWSLAGTNAHKSVAEYKFDVIFSISSLLLDRRLTANENAAQLQKGKQSRGDD